LNLSRLTEKISLPRPFLSYGDSAFGVSSLRPGFQSPLSDGRGEHPTGAPSADTTNTIVPHWWACVGVFFCPPVWCFSFFCLNISPFFPQSTFHLWSVLFVSTPPESFTLLFRRVLSIAFFSLAEDSSFFFAHKGFPFHTIPFFGFFFLVKYRSLLSLSPLEFASPLFPRLHPSPFIPCWFFGVPLGGEPRLLIRRSFSWDYFPKPGSFISLKSTHCELVPPSSAFLKGPLPLPFSSSSFFCFLFGQAVAASYFS